MHHARRSLRLKRPGSRFNSSSSKPEPRNLGKWAIPQAPAQPSSTASSSSSLASKWAIPQAPAQPSSTPSSSLDLPLRKWAHPPPPPTATDEPPVPNLPGLSKWARPELPPAEMTREKGATPPPPPRASSSRLKTITRAPPDSRWPTQKPPGDSRPSQFRRDPPLATTPPDSRRPTQKPPGNSRPSQFRRDPPPASIAYSPTSNQGSSAFRRDALPHTSEAAPGTPSSTQAPAEKQEPKQSSEVSASESESSETPTEDVVELELEVSDVAGNEEEGRGRRRGGKEAFKSRGSLRAPQTKLREHRKYEKDDLTPKPNTKKKLGSLRLKQVAADVFIPSLISVGNLARLLNVPLGRLQRKMVRLGMKQESSYDHLLTAEYASLIAMEYNRNPVVNDEAAFDIYPPPPAMDTSKFPSRPPIVTIMGHVDHGKTTLLDTLRSASVAKGEAGGITQHIGAFSVPVPSESGGQRTITFLDTPGHAAFSAMRARGASVTDIVVLVVAADDGIMPQTREVLELVNKDSTKVSLVVAINKIDKPGVDITKVENSLLAEGVQLETFGGDVPAVRVSGLTGQGLPDLIETISVVAEMQDIRAEQSGPIHGYVLESKVDKGLGAVATVLLLRGQLTQGMNLISGLAHGKVRLLKSPSGQSLKSVLPGTAALVSGWKELPKAGDEVLTGSEGDIKRALANRIRQAEINATIEDAEAINESRRAERELLKAEAEAAPGEKVDQEKDERKMLRLVIKGDVSGTVEAVAGAVQGIGNHLAGVKVVSQGVGEVSESDVMLAKAAEGVIIAFAVNTPRAIRNIAHSQGVKIIESKIIYQLMDEVKNGVIDLLPKITESRVIGEATVLQLFDIHLKAKVTKKVAGCRVTNGVVEKNKKARVVRNGEVVFDGKLETLRHLKKDILEASKGLECGIAFEDFNDLREGDLIQAYQEIIKPGSL